jgi:hypothetical protein
MMDKPEFPHNSFVTLPAIGSNGTDKGGDLIIRNSQTLQHGADRHGGSIVSNERMGKFRHFSPLFILPYRHSEIWF